MRCCKPLKDSTVPAGIDPDPVAPLWSGVWRGCGQTPLTRGYGIHLLACGAAVGSAT